MGVSRATSMEAARIGDYGPSAMSLARSGSRKSCSITGCVGKCSSRRGQSTGGNTCAATPILLAGTGFASKKWRRSTGDVGRFTIRARRELQVGFTRGDAALHQQLLKTSGLLKWSENNSLDEYAKVEVSLRFLLAPALPAAPAWDGPREVVPQTLSGERDGVALLTLVLAWYGSSTGTAASPRTHGRA